MYKRQEQSEEKFTRFIDDDIHQIAGGGLILFRPRGEHPHITAEEAHSGDDGDTADKKQDNTDQNRIRFIRQVRAYDEKQATDQGFKIYAAPTRGVNDSLSFRPDNPLVADLRVRQACLLYTSRCV